MAKTSRAAAALPAPRPCPNCGVTTWLPRALTIEKSDARDRDVRQGELDAIVAKRGALEACAGCGYQAHAYEPIAPAPV